MNGFSTFWYKYLFNKTMTTHITHTEIDIQLQSQSLQAIIGLKYSCFIWRCGYQGRPMALYLPTLFLKDCYFAKNSIYFLEEESEGPQLGLALKCNV